MSSKFTSDESEELTKIQQRKNNYSFSFSSVNTSQLSFEDNLAVDIERNLVRIQKVARKFCILNEESDNLKRQLDMVKNQYDACKHEIRFRNAKKKAKIRTYDRKLKITQTKVNKAVGVNKAIMAEVDSIRKMKKFEKDTDLRNIGKLRSLSNRVSRTSKNVRSFRANTNFTLSDFNGLIHNSKLKTIEKIIQVEKLQKLAPKLKPMKKVSLNYLKQMEPYELRIRDIIKTRIRKFYKKNLKKYDLTLNYVKDMQAIDNCFSEIKSIDANTEMREIISNLKRNHDKKNEVYSKMYEISKETENLQQKIDQEQEYNYTIMKLNAELIQKNDRDEKEMISNEEKKRKMKESLEKEIDELEGKNRVFKDLIFNYYCQFLGIEAALEIEQPAKKEELNFKNAKLKDLQCYLEGVSKSIIKYKEEMKYRLQSKTKRKSEVEKNRKKERAKLSEKKMMSSTMKTSVQIGAKKGSTGSPTRATAYQTGFGSVDGLTSDNQIFDVFRSRMLNERELNDILILDEVKDFDRRNRRVLNLRSVKQRNSRAFDRKNRSFILNRTGSIDLNSNSVISKEQTVL